MRAHEVSCIQTRLKGLNVDLHTRNAVAQEAKLSWLEGMDGLLIGGSGDYSVHHPNSQRFVVPMRRLLEAALAQGLPGFGLCFGHQLLGLHLGAEVVTDPACEEVGTVSVQLTDEGRQSELFQGFSERFPVHTGHSDNVVEVPDGLDLLATNERTSCQAFQVQGARFFSTQFHPDLSGAEAQSRYLINKRNPEGLLESGAETKATAYRPGEDITNTMLARFVALISEI